MFQGLGVALITPFRKDSSIDYDALARLVEHQINGGTDYLVVLGTTGEAVTLDEKEKKEVVQFVLKQVNGRIPVVVGLGGYNTQQIVRELQDFPFQEASGILSVAPYYNKPNQEGLYRHYQAIAEASPVPVILYNVPGRTGVNIEAKTTLALAKLEHIVAVKEASGKMEQIMSIAKDKPREFQLISGDDVLTVPLISCGGSGVISVAANAWPTAFKAIVMAAREGDFNKAMQLHFEFMTMIRLMFVDGNPAGIKYILSEMGMIENILRLPLVPVSEETATKIRGILDSIQY